MRSQLLEVVIELRHLHYFVAVAEELHFTRAAERLCIGQPPLSHAIQVLEADLGVLLFERNNRNVRLTEAGKLLLTDARQLLALAGTARQNVTAAARGEAGELRIGFTSSTPLTPLFSSLINAFRRQFPQISLIFHEMSTERQLAALQLQQLDLAFLRPQYGDPMLATVAEQLEFMQLRTDPLLVVLPEQHPLAAQATIELAGLATESFIMYPATAGTSIYRQILSLCLQAGFTPKVVQQAAEASTMIGLVAAGIGLTILPAAFARIQLDGVCYRPLAGEAAVTPLLLARSLRPMQQQKQALIQQFVAMSWSLQS